jgi:HEAT repeat protein
MKYAWLGLVVLMLLGGAVLGYVLLSNPQEAPIVQGDATTAPSTDTSDAKVEPATAETAADAKMLALKDPRERINHLDWVAGEPWARSSLPIFRNAIVSDPDETVQLHAVEKTLELAEEEGGGATAAVVRTSLASTKGNTRARGLRAARESPNEDLVPTLIELVDHRDPYATMALNALAYTNSPDAYAKVFEVAQDSSTDARLRERAVALLAVTKEREARPLLTELANGENETLRVIAQEVLKVLNEG